MRVQIARESCIGRFYRIALTGKLTKYMLFTGTKKVAWDCSGHDLAISPRLFNKMTYLRLDPGEGPIEADLSLEFPLQSIAEPKKPAKKATKKNTMPKSIASAILSRVKHLFK